MVTLGVIERHEGSPRGVDSAIGTELPPLRRAQRRLVCPTGANLISPGDHAKDSQHDGDWGQNYHGGHAATINASCLLLLWRNPHHAQLERHNARYLISLAFILGMGTAHADRPVTQEESERLNSALRQEGCTGGKMEFEDGKFEVERRLSSQTNGHQRHLRCCDF
jgi:hypothetical protein